MVRICLLLGFLMFSSSAWAGLESKDFAPVDRSFISLLILSGQENRSAIDKFSQFQKAWEDLKAAQDEEASSEWDKLVAKVDEKMMEAERLINEEQWLQVQGVVDPIADELKAYREKQEIEYYLDYLGYAYKSIRPMAEAARARMEERQPISMYQVFDKHYNEASSLWDVVKKVPFSAEDFDFTSARENQRRQAVAAMDDALYQVLKAYRYGSGEDIARAMLKLETIYRKLYSLFSDLDVQLKMEPK